MIIYETDRFYVRPFEKSDMTERYRSWFHDQTVTKYNSHGLFPYTKEQMSTFLARLESSDDLVWAVFAKYKPKDGRRIIKFDEDHVLRNVDVIHIGNVSLQNINWINKSAEFATIFGEKEYWGKGFCTEAARMIFSHAFQKLNLHRVFTGTAATNIGMRKVAKKLGMTNEGVFIEATFLDGKYVDIFEYGITEQMWRAKNERKNYDN